MKIKAFPIVVLTVLFCIFLFPVLGFAQNFKQEKAVELRDLSSTSENPWKMLHKGLQIAYFKTPLKSPVCDYPVTVLRVDPSLYQFRLLCASEHGGKPKTARAWAKAFDLVAAINAAMYSGDYETSTGLMKNYAHTNNGAVNPRFGAFMAFNPIDEALSPVRIIDRYSGDWKKQIKKYHTVIQNYRMISPAGENLWKPSEKIYSIAAVAMDRRGNVLLIHSRAPFSVYDFNRILLALPLDIKNAMYVEGGPEATLYVNAGKLERQWAGSYETLLTENGDHAAAWEIPNIIGIRRKP